MLQLRIVKHRTTKCVEFLQFIIELDPQSSLLQKLRSYHSLFLYWYKIKIALYNIWLTNELSYKQTTFRGWHWAFWKIILLKPGFGYVDFLNLSIWITRGQPPLTPPPNLGRGDPRPAEKIAEDPITDKYLFRFWSGSGLGFWIFFVCEYVQQKYHFSEDIIIQ